MSFGNWNTFEKIFLIENGSIPWGSKTNSNAIFKTYEVSID
jgi:hypothetical protein